MNFRPMKPINFVSVGEDALRFPFFLSEKYDGIRVLVDLQTGNCFSSSMKPIPNKQICETIRNDLPALKEYHGLFLEGELMIPNKTFSELSGIIRSYDKPAPDFQVHFFDVSSKSIASKRIEEVKSIVEEFEFFSGEVNSRYFAIPQQWVTSYAEVREAYEKVILKGGEGVILKAPNEYYKNGRAGKTKQELIKIKEELDEEVVIVGFKEKMKNNNEIIRDNYGLAKRSTHKENLEPLGTLGALIVKKGDTEFSVGSGFTDAVRKEFWENQEKYLGETITIRFMGTGVKDAPRHPRFKGIRWKHDS